MSKFNQAVNILGNVFSGVADAFEPILKVTAGSLAVSIFTIVFATAPAYIAGGVVTLLSAGAFGISGLLISGVGRISSRLLPLLNKSPLSSGPKSYRAGKAFAFTAASLCALATAAHVGVTARAAPSSEKPEATSHVESKPHMLTLIKPYRPNPVLVRATPKLIS